VTGGSERRGYRAWPNGPWVRILGTAPRRGRIPNASAPMAGEGTGAEKVSALEEEESDEDPDRRR
jgi:hypothetical protein